MNATLAQIVRTAALFVVASAAAATVSAQSVGDFLSSGGKAESIGGARSESAGQYGNIDRGERVNTRGSSGGERGGARAEGGQSSRGATGGGRASNSR